MPRCRAPIALILPLIILAFAKPAFSRSRPDQVLVIYNADWPHDLDQSEPGQDSREIARYYVKVRTDLKTGRKPWILGLSAGGGAASPLNSSTLKEKSGDNRNGLILVEGGRVEGASPLSSIHGDSSVPFGLIKAGCAPRRYAGLFLRKSDLPPGPGVLRLTASHAVDGVIQLGAWTGKEQKTHPALSTFPTEDGLLLAVDLLALTKGFWTLEISVRTALGEKRLARGTFVLPAQSVVAANLRSITWGQRPESLKLPDKSGPLTDLLTFVDLASHLTDGRLGGLTLTRTELQAIDPGTLELSVAPAGKESRPSIIYRESDHRLWPSASLFRLADGALFLSVDLSQVHAGTIDAVWTARKQSDGTLWKKTIRLYNPNQVRLTLTGPDGIRDDANYLSLIEAPVRRFLETHQTDDGIPLIDHVLYFVVVHGLPYQVRSSFGIARGVLKGRKGNIGSGSALSQRLMLLDYDVAAHFPTPRVLMEGGGPKKIGQPFIAHPLTACMTGARFNPLLHPLTHRKDLRKKAFERSGVKAATEGIPPPLSSKSRRSIPPGQKLFGASRIDADSVELARAQVDGAIYAEHFLTPELGPVFHGSYQEGPMAAQALAARGFKTMRLGEPADRALFYFGILNSGLTWQDDRKGKHDATPVWGHGFYPGSVAYAIRSFLGWDRRRTRGPTAALFEQIVRGGASVSAGSSGGAHDTNLTWPDAFVLVQLLLDGYEFGDAALRSLLYLDWTLSLVGDPLYRPCLADTSPDTSPPEVAVADGGEFTLMPAGPGTFALHAAPTLTNSEPEMAEIVLTCRPVGSEGESVIGRNTRYSTRPEAWALPLLPDREYDVTYRLIDPYGNTFDSPVRRIVTGPPPVQRELKHGRLRSWLGKDTLRFNSRPLDDAAEIELRFVVGESLVFPQIQAEDRKWLLHGGKSLRLGGVPLHLDASSAALEKGTECRLLLRWRRVPLTREAWLIARDGSRHLLASENHSPWDGTFTLGNKLTISSATPVREIIVRDNPTPAQQVGRPPLPRKLDGDAFRKANAAPK